MILADTSIWIEYLKGNQKIRKEFGKYLLNGQIVTISAVFGELLQGAKNNRESSIIQSYWENLPGIDEDELFIKAGILSNNFNLLNQGIGLIDAYLIAAVLKHDLYIWTLDKKLNRALNLF